MCGAAAGDPSGLCHSPSLRNSTICTAAAAADVRLLLLLSCCESPARTAVYSPCSNKPEEARTTSTP
jgi:hypothetical protein